MANTGVTIKVGLQGGPTARREAASTGHSIEKMGESAGHAGKKVKLAEISTKGWEKSSERLKDVLKDLAGVTGIAGLAFGTGEIVKSAIQAQNAQLKLRQTLKNTGLSWGKYGEEIEKAVDKQAIRTGFGPAEVTESFTNSLRTTRNVTGALKLNALALDVARAKGMNLAGAQSLIARVYNGSYIGLKRLGIGITNVTTEQDALRDSGKKYTSAQLARAKADDKATTKTTALRLVQQNFGRLADAQAKGAQGSIDRLKASLEVIQEKLGAVILPYVAKGASKLADVATKIGEHWPEISATISRNADKIKTKLAPLMSFISTHRKAIGEFAAGFTALALSLKVINKVGKVTGLSKIASTVTKHSALGKILGVVKADGTPTRPFYVVVLDKAPKGGARKIVDAVKKVGPAAAGIGSRFLPLAGEFGGPVAAGAGIGFLAWHNASNNFPSGPGGAALRRQASKEPLPPGFGGSSVLKRVITPPNAAAVRQAAGGGTTNDPLSLAALAILNGGLTVHNNTTSIVKLPNGKELARSVTHSANKAKSLK